MSRQVFPTSGPSQRQLRVGELVRHALADILSRGQVNDPALDGRIITVPEVRMSPDLKIANAFVRTLLPNKEKALLEALNRNRSYIRGLVSPKLEMKFTPEIRYRVDTALDYAGKIDELLRSPEVARDLDKK